MLTFFCQLEDEIADKQTFFSGLLLSVYNTCLGHFTRNAKSEEIHRTLKESLALGKAIMAAKHAGIKFAKEAIWVPVRRCVQLATPFIATILTPQYSRIAKPVHDKHMVETATLYKAGEKSGAIDNDAEMVGLPQGWRLIAAPPAMSESSYALIFWEPEDAEDDEPTFDKVVCTCLGSFCKVANTIQIGACIYGADKRNPALADPNSKHIQLQCAAAAHNLK